MSHGPKNSVSLNKAATKNLPKGRHEERQTRNTKDIMKRTDEERVQGDKRLNTDSLTRR